MTRFWLRTSLHLAIFGLSAAAMASPQPQGVSEPPEIFRDSMEEFVVLHGQARFLAPLAGAQITVSGSDGRQTSTEADGDGRFTIRLELLSSQTVYEARARGIGGQAHEEYASWLGQRDFLLERAGVDREVSEADLPALRLNPFQTGLYVAMRDLPVSPLTPANRDFERRARSFSAMDFYYRAPLIAMLGAGDLALPEGAQTTLQAVSSQALALQAQLVVEQDTSSCPDNPLCTATDRVRRDPDQLPLIPPPMGITIQPYITYAVGSTIDSPRFQLEPGGSGTLGTSSGFGAPTGVADVNWIDTGDYTRITRTDDSPFSESISYPFHPSCSCQVKAVYSTVAYRMIFADGPAGTLLLGHNAETEITYPENPEIPTVVTTSAPAITFGTVLDDVGLSGFSNPGGSPLVLPTCLLPDCSLPPSTNIFHSNQPVITEPHHFNPDGTGNTTRLDQTFTWNLAGGVLQVEYASGTSASWAMASADRQYGTTTGVFTTADGIEMPVSRMFAPAQPGAQFHAGNVAGISYQSRIGDDYPYSILSPGSSDRPGTPPSARLKFNADGTGEDPNGANYALTWSIDDAGRLTFVRERIGFPPNSIYPHRRTWELIAEDAQSILVLESIEVPELVGGVYQPLPAERTIYPTGRLFRYTKH